MRYKLSLLQGALFISFEIMSVELIYQKDILTLREPSHYVINLLADFRETLSQIVSNHGQCKPLRLAMSRVKKRVHQVL